MMMMMMMIMMMIMMKFMMIIITHAVRSQTKNEEHYRSLQCSKPSLMYINPQNYTY